MAIRSGGPAPYAPSATVLGLIQSFRDRGLTVPFTPEVLVRAGVSETLAPRTLLSLKGLDLVDEKGNPTPALEGLRRVPEAEFKKRLEEIVRGVYAEVFQFTDPAKDDADKISDAFRAYDPPGQRARMVSLFTGLCEAAGIIPEGTRKPAPAAPRVDRSNRAPRPAARTGSVGAMARVRNFDDKVIPSAITGMLGSLPGEGETWTQGRRDAFVKTFESVLDFCYPVGPDAAGEEAE